MLDDHSPEHWADAPLPELEAEIRAIERWSEREAEVVDFAYRERTMRTLSRTRAGSQDEASALAVHVQRVAHDTVRAELDGLERPYFTRWRMLAELLTAFGLHLEVPGSVLERKHVETILLELHERGGKIAQGDLRHIIANEGQRSATLKLMEAWDLVERTPGATGNTRIVAITDLGRLAIAGKVETREAAAPAPSERPVWGMTG